VADVEVTREIRAPAELVWGLVADVTRMPEWSPQTIAIEWLRGANRPVRGASFRGTNRNGTKTWKSVSTVVDADPGKAFSFLVKVGGMSVAEWGYTFAPTADGCAVTESWTDRRNPLLKLLSGPATGVADRASHNRAGMTQTLERLATAAESSSPGD